jgi:hypothetical protein
MELKKLFNMAAITVIGNLVRFGLIILVALGITLLTMMAVTTIGTIFELRLPYRIITAIVGIIAFLALSVVTLVWMKPQK